MIKKLISFLISICLLGGMCVNVSAVGYGEELKNAPVKTYEQKFSDVPESYWAFSYISEMTERGVLSGYPDGKFYPDAQVSRAEFAKIMTTAAGLSVTEPITQLFADVQISEWYAPYVHTAKEYLSAYSQGGASYYLPNTPALREDIAVALVKLKGYSTTGADLTTLQRMFSDYQSISENAKIYVAAAIENGLISGYSDGTFKGQSSITRAEAATLLWRAYQYGNSNKNYDNLVEIPNDDKSANVDTEEAVEDKKPYVMKELASASVDNMAKATLDENGYIFFIDADNCIYKVNVLNGNKEEYMNINNLSYETETEEYTSFVPIQVYYDNVNGRLLLNGHYKNFIELSKSPQNGIDTMFIYDITEKSINVICKYHKENTYYGDDYYERFYIQTFLNSKNVLMHWGTLINVNNCNATDAETGYWEEYSATIYNNRLYGLHYDSSCQWNIEEYDFNNDVCNTHSEIDSFDSYSFKDDSYYFYNREGMIYKISLSTGKTTILDINTDSDSVDFEDMVNMNNVGEKFFVVDDDTMIFYDEYIEAFRILKKN